MTVHVFNLDPAWNFPQLVIEQGLDLFPAASGVELVNFSANEDRGGGLAGLFRSWPTIASGEHIIGHIEEFVTAVQSQNPGAANIGLLVCLGRDALDRFRPEKPRTPVPPETAGVQKRDDLPQMLASRRRSLPADGKAMEQRDTTATAAEAKGTVDPLTLLIQRLNGFRASSMTQKTFTITFFSTAQGETDRVAAFEAAQALLLQLDDSIRWLSSVVICAENGTISFDRSFAYLRTLIDMLQDRTARADSASTDLRGKLFVQTSGQHGGATGQALWLTNLDYGKTYSASLRWAIAGEIHAAARNLTLSETSTIAKVPLPGVQLAALLKTLDTTANNLSAKAPVSSGGGEGGERSPVQPVSFSAEGQVSKAVLLVRADVEKSTSDALSAIQEGLDKARKDVATVDDQIEAAQIQVGGTEAWRDNATSLNRSMQQTADRLAATARATRERAKFLTVTQGGDGKLLIELERLPQWKKTETDIGQYYELRGFGVSGRNATVQLFFGIVVPIIVALGPYRFLIQGAGTPSTVGQAARPEMAFVIAFCIAFVLLSGFVAISASHFLLKRRMTLKRNDAEVAAGTLKADLVASAQAVEVARAAAIASGHNRILARKVRDALGRSRAIMSLADLVPSLPDRNLVDDAVSKAFIEQFTTAHAHNDGADRIRVAIVKSLALFRDSADGTARGPGQSRLQIDSKDENLDDYPVVANFSPGLVNVDVDKITVTGA